jgi:hypothetical protein
VSQVVTVDLNTLIPEGSRVSQVVTVDLNEMIPEGLTLSQTVTKWVKST